MSALKQIEKQIAKTLAVHGVVAEVTFYAVNGVSVLVDDAAQFETAKRVLSFVPNVRFDSEDRDEECGNVAYYKF